MYTLLESEDTSCEMDVDVEEETTNVSTPYDIIVTLYQSSIPPSVSSSLLSLAPLLASLLKHSTNNTPESMNSKTLSKIHRRKRERKKKEKEEITRDSLNRDQKPDVC